MRRSLFPALTVLAVARLACGQDADSSGVRVTMMAHLDGTKSITKTDTDNHTSEEDTYSGAGRLLRKIICTLDDQNNAVQGLVYDAKGHELYKALYKRNEMGKVTEETEYTPDDKLLGRFVYRYDDTGRLMKIDAYGADGGLVPQTDAIPQKNKSLPRRIQ